MTTAFDTTTNNVVIQVYQTDSSSANGNYIKTIAIPMWTVYPAVMPAYSAKI